jgi:hypothetical protein
MKTIIQALSGAFLAAVLLALFLPSSAWTKAVGLVGQITADQIDAGAVGTSEIADGTIVAADLASGIIITTTGSISGDVGPIISLASGALTANRTHLATAAADYVLPACEAANIGEWVTVIVQDISEVVVLQPATGDTINPAGAVIDINHEMDSSGAATGDGDFVTLVCVIADMWFSTAIGGAWVDGGAS